MGAGTWEEVNDAVVGGHYGWPCREGPAVGPSPDAGCREPTTDPVLWYNHSTGCNVETGGAFVPPKVWPGFDNAYLWVDFGCGSLFIAQPGQTGTPPAVLATGMQQTTDLEFFTANGEYVALLHHVCERRSTAPRTRRSHACGPATAAHG